MVLLTSLEERRRRSRNIVLAAFALLVLIWTVKLAYPQANLISAFQTHSHSSGSEYATEEVPAKKESATKDPGFKSRPGLDVLGTPEDISNGTISNKAAVIIEPQFRTSLIPLILHYNTVLGPTWPILIYTTAEAVAMFTTSAALSRYMKTGTIQLRILPQTVLLTNSDELNDFMADTWLWENLEPAEHILIFQSDSMLCANAARSVDDFFQYDLIGIPPEKDGGTDYNGGLSLRKRSTVLRVLDTWEWKTSKKKEDRWEDKWFLDRISDLQLEEAGEDIEPKGNGTILLPTKEVARTFSVETIDYPHPLGVHQVHRWLEDQTAALDEWCPEYKLCSESSIKEAPAPE